MSDPQPEYLTFDLHYLWAFLRSPKLWPIALIVGVWVGCSFTIFNSSFIQFLPDTFMYKELAQLPMGLDLFVHGNRAPMVPVLLKLFKTEEAFVWFQLLLFFFCWGSLFALLYDVIKNYWAFLGLMFMLVCMSLTQAVFSWHKLILTESTSLSGWILLLALLCRFLQRKEVSTAFFFYTLITWILWEFTRDQNAFISQMVSAGFFVICCCSSLGDRKNQKWKKGQLISIIIFTIALFQMFSINTSERWKFPMVDVIGSRILPYEDRTQEFIEMGMPMNDKVACFRGKGSWDCNRDWSGFGEWFTSGKARQDYEKWLFKHLLTTAPEVLYDWKEIWNSESVFYGHANESPISIEATKISLPKGEPFLELTALSLFASLVALCVVLRAGFNHWLSIVLMFYYLNFPMAFIAYHAAPFEMFRHTVHVQLNSYLTGWILIFWLASATFQWLFKAIMTTSRTPKPTIGVPA